MFFHLFDLTGWKWNEIIWKSSGQQVINFANWPCAIKVIGLLPKKVADTVDAQRISHLYYCHQRYDGPLCVRNPAAFMNFTHCNATVIQSSHSGLLLQCPCNCMPQCHNRHSWSLQQYQLKAVHVTHTTIIIIWGSFNLCFICSWNGLHTSCFVPRLEEGQPIWGVCH